MSFNEYTHTFVKANEGLDELMFDNFWCFFFSRFEPVTEPNERPNGNRIQHRFVRIHSSIVLARNACQERIEIENDSKVK